MYYTIGAHLQEKEEIEWDPKYRRIRCIGHVINLAVQAFLFQSLIDTTELTLYDNKEASGEARGEILIQKKDTFRGIGPLGKLYNIVVHIRNSAGRTKEFKDLAGRMIPLGNRTR